MMKQKSCSGLSSRAFLDSWIDSRSKPAISKRSPGKPRGLSVSASAFAWLALGSCCPLRHCLHTCGVKAAMGHATVTTGL